MPRVVTNTTYESFFWVEWNQVSQDIPGNKTKINWACGVSCGHSFLVNAIRMSDVYINGVLVHREKTYSNFSKGNHTIESGTMDIPHGANGQKTFYISRFTGWLYSNYNYTAEASSHNLPNIPRKATITAASDITDQQNPSITISNPSGFKMDVWLEPNPVGDHLCVRNGISLDANGRYTWEITPDEREELRNHCPGPECTIRVGVYTHIGSETDADYKDKKFTMVEGNATRPTVSMSISLDNGSLPSKFNGLYIQGKSRAKVTLSATGKYGAGIQNLYATTEGKTYSPPEFTTDVVQRPGNVDIVGYARDTRGFSGEAKQSITVIEYSKPLVVPVGSDNAILCYRSDGNGVQVGASTSVWIKAKRSYHSVSGKNTCALQWRAKLSSDPWKDGYLWNDLLSGTGTADEFSGLIEGVVFDLDKSYTVQIRAIDDIGEQDIKTLDIPTRDVALHLGKGGRNVSVGSYCDYTEPYTFHSEWDCIFDKDVRIAGDLLLGDSKMTLKDYILNVINEGG